MKITVEVPDKECIRAMRIGWNVAYGEHLEDSDFKLPPITELTDLPYKDDIMRAIPYFIDAKVIRVS